MSELRHVRPTDDFTFDLERQLGSEPGPNGEPSLSDFESYVLPTIYHRFATGWSDLPAPFPFDTRVRELINEGYLVRGYRVLGEEQPDGGIHLIFIRLDMRPVDGDPID